ncbi:hypothetical protein [Brumimicrobium aurantiacum]|uniref:Uncharacterized protein n=1 Tax=Brumimicrobium aurantiacum TaxID=1737063 RepID=A0A3E1EWD9_9FLAO|nr:hypothetical protein [Brumimicrobium aurantiacum]RFC53869.1 hypothetical protein DXU93_09985 [Brumimicrobium aurantiacum]
MGVIDNLGKKLDSRPMGIVFGLVLPVFGFVIFWQWKHGARSFDELYHFLAASPNNRNDLLVFSVIPNLLLFYLTNFRWRWDKFTTGLVGVTIILSVVVASLILL